MTTWGKFTVTGVSHMEKRFISKKRNWSTRQILIGPCEHSNFASEEFPVDEQKKSVDEIFKD